MTSLVNPSNINGNFPIAGQDNDSQGFRDNFTNIRNNFTFIKSEIEDIQAKAVLKSALIGTTLNNDFQGSKVKNLQISNLTETVKDLGQYAQASLQIDLAEGNIVKLVATQGNSIEINSVIKNWPSSLQYTRILVYITIPATDITLTVPQNWSTDLSAIPGLRRVEGASVISYTDPGDYVYEITSVDSGTTVYFRELTTGNALFRDPNFYMLGYGIGKVDDVPQKSGFGSPTLILGFGKYLGGATIESGVAFLVDDLKDGNDSLLVKGSITSYQSEVDDIGNVSAGVNSLTSAGFSVVKDRTYIDTEAGDAVSLAKVEDQDLIGYFNGVAYTPNNLGATNLSYQQVASVQYVASGATASPYGIGGSILIKTKGDGTADLAMPDSVVGAYNYNDTAGALRTAIEIDNKQNVTIYGNLSVMGQTTVIESTTVSVEDKNIVLGAGGTETTNQGAGFSVVSGAADGGANLTLVNAGWVTNRSFTIANTSPANALVVSGNARVGGNLYIDGNLIVSTVSYEYREVVSTTETVQGNLVAASSTPSTSTTTGALIVTGGAGIGNGLYVNGTTYLQNMSTGNAVISGGSAYDLTHLAATGGAVSTFTAANFTSANLWIRGGVIGMATDGTVTPASNAYIYTGWFANVSTANAMITGGSISGVSVDTNTLAATNFSTGNAVISGGYAQGLSNVYATTAQFTNVSSGNAVITGGTGVFSTLVATNLSSSNLRVTGGSVTGGTGAFSTLVATNFSSGNIYQSAAGTLVATNFSTGNAVITSGTATTLVVTNFSSGNAAITGGSVTGITGAASTLVATNFSTGNAVITSGTATTLVATNFSTGNAVITGGYIQTVANLYATGIGNFGSVFSANVTTANVSAFTNDARAATTNFVRQDGGKSTQVIFSTATAGTTTWTIPAGVVKVKATVIGGGGGGGGSAAAIGAAGGGGASGSVGTYYFTTLTPGGSITYGVGLGGTSSVGAAGTPGGPSNVSVGGITITAPGGLGGTAGAAATNNYAGGTPGATASQSGGTASAFYGTAGNAGGNSIGTAAAATAAGGQGANGFNGGAGRGGLNGSVATAAGAGTGAGGGGAISLTAATVAGANGGSGAVIFEY